MQGLAYFYLTQNEAVTDLELVNKSVSGHQNEILRAEEAKAELSGVTPRWFRPVRAELIGQALAAALKENRQVTHIGLKDNRIGDAGAKAWEFLLNMVLFFSILAAGC